MVDKKVELVHLDPVHRVVAAVLNRSIDLQDPPERWHVQQGKLGLTIQPFPMKLSGVEVVGTVRRR